MDLHNDAYAMSRLKGEAERCKKELSEKESVKISLPFIAEKNGRPLSISEELTRDRFEAMVTDLIERTHAPITRVLSDSKLTPEEIDRVILVGGSTRMKLVSKDIQAFLNITPQTAVDPDLAVAEGAAIQAGIIEGSINSEESFVFTDVNPYSLGIRTFNGISMDHMSVLIRRNTTIPVTKRDTFRTTFDYQDEVVIEVYQGESDIASHNHFLGSFHMRDIPEKKAGREKLNVEFAYDLNGMLKVSAVVLSTGQKASIDIDMVHAKEE
ncbi:MAG: Hsp70 family protein [Lachnospiraceae bacterium]|nr:Hsp70 family protein [Lachnospiraceae bacterium]